MKKRTESLFHFDFREPFICTAIHNGHYVDEALIPNFGITEDERLREEDPKTEYFTKIASNRIVQYRSRFDYDLNRPRERAFYLKPEDAWGLNVRRVRPDDNLIEKSLACYDLFYRRTKILFDEMAMTHKTFFVYDIHSYNHHRQGAGMPFDPEENNPEIILGTSNMPERWHPIVEEIRTRLSSFNFFGRALDVRINVKFPGGHFSRWIHSNYPEQACCIAIELKKIFMDEWSGIFYPEVMQELRNALSLTRPYILDYLHTTRS